ncbi:major facilitator superfamily domain-containing protein [Thamnidium elegans]|nr:major facilitator superfamily domain-containing protein [Thamnidium elegans]
MILQAISPTFWGTIADSWGRRPVLLMTMVIYCASCIGLALTPNYAVLMVLRMIQAFGSSSLIAISAGPVLGPVLGGIISEKLGWRWIFWVLLILGCSSLLIVGFFVPETLRVLVGNGSGYANPTPSQWLKKHRSKELDQDKKKLEHPKMNFLAPFTYLLEPDVFLILWLNGVAFTVFYCIMTSTTKQFSIYYPYLSELEIGVCFLSMGLGTIIGGFAKGKLLDRDYRKTSYKAEFSIYTARLKNIWFHLMAMQVATCIYGWIIQIGAPLPAALAIQFVFAFSCSGVTSTCQTLLVDLFPGRGASITASNNLMRCILGAAATAYIEPAIQGVIYIYI